MSKEPALLAVAAGFAAGALKERSPDSLLNVRRDHFLKVVEVAKALPAEGDLIEALEEVKSVSLKASVVEVPAGVLAVLCEPVVAYLEAKAKAEAAKVVEPSKAAE